MTRFVRGSLVAFALLTLTPPAEASFVTALCGRVGEVGRVIRGGGIRFVDESCVQLDLDADGIACSGCVKSDLKGTASGSLSAEDDAGERVAVSFESAPLTGSLSYSCSEGSMVLTANIVITTFEPSPLGDDALERLEITATARQPATQPIIIGVPVGRVILTPDMDLSAKAYRPGRPTFGNITLRGGPGGAAGLVDGVDDDCDSTGAGDGQYKLQSGFIYASQPGTTP